MKKISMLLGTACAFAAILSSCSKMDVEEQVEPEVIGGEITLTINAGGSESKTFVDGTAIKWNSTGEFLRVFEDADEAISSKKSEEGTTTDEGATMSFNVSLGTKTASSFKYYAIYPDASYQSSSGIKNIAINSQYAQTPTATSFDPAADLLIAEPVDNGDEQPTSLSMAFARVLAIGKMTVKNLGSDDPVKSITFSAKDGETAIPLAGRTSFDISAAKPASDYGDRTANNFIVLDYSALDLTADGSTGMDAWFTCFPFDLASGDSFKVIVETETQTFTKEVILTTQNLSFKAGLASRFTVNMDGIAGETKAVDLKYAQLTGNEVRDAGITSSAYGSLNLTKPAYKDNWKGFVNSTNSGNFGIRRNDNKQNDSYLQLPTFVNNLDSVVVTLSTAMAADKSLTLETEKDATGGTIASLTTVADQLIYTFDLTGLAERVKTGYLRASGVAAYIAKVEMFSGTRDAAISAPASVSATLNSDDPAVTNTIDVSWEAVSGAASYEVTLTPEAGDPVVATTVSTSYSFSGLAFLTSYTPSVVAIAADPYLYMNSASQAGSPESTGEASNSTIVDRLTLATTGVSGANYTEFSGQTASSDAVYAGQCAGGNSSIQLRSSNNNSGVITTASGGKVKKIKVTWNSNTASGRTLNIYGKNSAYSSAEDLYNASNQGTLLGTIVKGTSTELTVTGDYSFIGFRSNSGALYLDEVEITWDTDDD